MGLLPLAGCIASAPGSNQQQPITVTVTSAQSSSPASVPVSPLAGSTLQFSATVTGTSNQAVNWSLALSPNSAATASGAGLGEIDNNGLYTAPSSIPACAAGIASCQLQVAVIATSQASTNTSYSGQAPVNVHVAISIAPTNVTTIGQGANLQFTANVTGATGPNSQGVNWHAVGNTSGVGGGAFDGYNIGLYVAPSLPENTPSASVTVTGTSVFDQSQNESINLTVALADPIGSVTSETSISCPTETGAVSGGNCYDLNVSCPGIPDMDAYLKVNPATNPIGTVLFLIGSGGSGLYDDQTTGFTYGATTVGNVFAQNYNTVQVSFGAPFVTTAPNGWLQGPGGVRRLACRFATVADWVYKNPSIINSSVTAPNSAPMCSAANSAGASAVAYAVSEYGLTSEFTMIEQTSGPVTTRIDQGCICFDNPNGPQGPCSNNTTSMCYSAFDAGILNNAYTSTQSCTNANAQNANLFLSDSIDFAGNLPIPLPGVTVNMAFGGQDTSAAVPQALTWEKFLGQTKPNVDSCIDDAPHGIPDVLDGAQQIANDIIAMCK